MERYEALEILRLYEHDDVTGVNGESAAEIYRNRNKLVLKAQELLLSDKEWEPAGCECCQKEPVPEDESCSEGEPDEEFEKWIKSISKSYGRVFYMGGLG